MVRFDVLSGTFHVFNIIFEIAKLVVQKFMNSVEIKKPLLPKPLFFIPYLEHVFLHFLTNCKHWLFLRMPGYASVHYPRLCIDVQ